MSRRARDILEDLLTLDSWVTSDQHWGEGVPGRPHDVLKLTRRAWLLSVMPGDVVLCLGDLTSDGRALAALPGRKLLILGNMDKFPKGWYEERRFQVLGRGDRPFYWEAPGGQLVAFSHEPLGREGEDEHPFDVNVHGHIHQGPLWGGYAPGRRVNVCVDVTDFTPIRLRDALARAS